MEKRFATLCCSVLTAALSAAVPVTEIPGIKAPELNGVIGASEWRGALQKQLQPISAGRTMTQPTLCYIGCDKENLYLAFRCSESEIGKMRCIHTHIEERDSTIYNDDCIEIFVDPSGNDESGLFHFAINSCGLIYDAFKGDASFQSAIKVACKVEKDFWVVEAQIPFSDFGFTPCGAETFRMNLGRERPFGAEYTCLKPGNGSFHNRSHFLTFKALPQGVNAAPVTF